MDKWNLGSNGIEIIQEFGFKTLSQRIISINKKKEEEKQEHYFNTMKVAIVHDCLNEFGGAERVLLALSKSGQASIYTTFYRTLKASEVSG